MHKEHKDLIDTLAGKIGSKTELAGELTNVTGLRATRAMISNWRHDGISWRYRGAFAQLATSYGVKMPDDFLLVDND